MKTRSHIPINNDVADYSKMTNEEFDEILSDLVYEYLTDDHYAFMLIPGVYECMSEHFNNEVLDRWTADQEEDFETEEEEEDDNYELTSDYTILNKQTIKFKP